MSKASEKAAVRAEAIENLRERLAPKSVVYTSVAHVSASGMSRTIRCYIVHDGQIENITWLVGKAIDESWDERHWGLKVSGCGMDMCFHTVYRLGSVLWPNGTPEPHSTRNGDPDSTGGYALNKRDL